MTKKKEELKREFKDVVRKTEDGKDVHEINLQMQIFLNKYEERSLGDDEIVMVGSTGERSRYGDYIAQGAWEGGLVNYKLNPVILLNHNYQGLPIGKAVSVEVQGANLIFHIKFDLNDPDAVKVMRKYKDGFMFASSVGFMVLDYEFDNEKDGYVYLSTELLELSLCTVPADAKSLVKEKMLVTHDMLEDEVDDGAEIEQRVSIVEDDDSVTAVELILLMEESIADTNEQLKSVESKLDRLLDLVDDGLIGLVFDEEKGSEADTVISDSVETSTTSEDLKDIVRQALNKEEK